jgi:hypothetical protein
MAFAPLEIANATAASVNLMDYIFPSVCLLEEINFAETV